MGHVKMEGSACPLAFLVTDVAHREEGVRASYQQSFSRLVQGVGDVLRDQGKAGAESLAEELVISMIGAVSIARSMSEEGGQSEFLARNKARLLALIEKPSV